MGEKMNDTKAVAAWVREHLGLELDGWQRFALERVMRGHSESYPYGAVPPQEHREPHMKGNTVGEPIYDEAFLTEENDG